MIIPRIYDNLEEHLRPNRVLVLYGPRQVGKTTLLNRFLKSTALKFRFDSGEDIRIQELLGSQDIRRLREYAEGVELIAIDEAQKVKGVGQGLKILVDHCPGIRVFVTGSSSFELAGQVGEPLTGRKTTLTLFPVAQMELNGFLPRFDLKENLESYLIYGAYPEVLTVDKAEDKRRVLHEIAGSYLMKDVLALEKVRNPKVLLDLLRLLAFQVGQEVSLSELAAPLGRDYKTVARYLQMLEESFVIFNLRGFSRNLRKELFKKSKYYFYDNGIRNAVISNFNPISLRDDVGRLWENFLVMERRKKQVYGDLYANTYFWRTWDQQEIDLVEEREGKLFGYEFAWGSKSRRPPRDWQGTYANASYEVINRENYFEFIL